MQAREEKARKTKRKPRGKAPKPPTPGPRAKDQYNFTDPESRITPAPPPVRVKNSTNAGFDQHYNAQAAVEQKSFMIVANGLSNHPNDQAEALPTLDALAPELGRPLSAALDNGFFSAANIAGIEARGIEPYIATGREPHTCTTIRCVSQKLGGPAGGTALAPAGRGLAGGQDGLQASDGRGACDLSLAQMHRGAGDTHPPPNSLLATPGRG